MMANRHVKVDIEKMLAKAQPLFTNECRIYKVPHAIRQLNEAAYTPEVVSIGPFHHGNEKLLKMEGHKQVYCRHFIKRSEASLDDLVSCVRELEPSVRSCYSENIKLGVDELVKVILVDCGFVIELFLRNVILERDDVISERPWLVDRITKDLLLLENQLPLFAFQKLYSLAFPSVLIDGRYPPFLHLASEFFEGYNKSKVLPSLTSNMAHFTDLLRTFYLQPSHGLPPREDEMLCLHYSASELKEAGVKFKVNKRSHCLLDFQFSCCTLKIPQIIVDDDIEMLLRNMVALEQCHYHGESYITNYAEFLDCLIDTDKDVDVLVKHEIILNWLGDNNSVAKLFNGLVKNITVSNCNADYLRICNELGDFCKNCWHSKMATLRRDYCNTPWKTVASIAGIALLILTFIQTVCSVL